MVKIAVLGYGTVGSGVVEIIRTNTTIINKKAEKDIDIKYVLDLRDFPGDPVEKILVHDFDVIVNDPEVDIVVEVMGGVEPAYTFVKKCLLAGKSVCTSNKELVAKKGTELLAIAKEKNINFLFEASCGGGIPVIRALNNSLTADDILEVSGILNGTTNYILTQMGAEGWDFDVALKTAQDLGYAERNPEADIEGYDACRKIAILSSLAFGSNVNFENVYTEGISKITAEDIKYADKLGYGIKLIAQSKKVNGNYYAMVAPMLIPNTHPLYSVNGVFNGIFIKGNVLGDIMLYGSGAGKLPTASAVVADVVDAAKHIDKNMTVFWSEEDLALTGIENAVRKFLVRVKGDNKADVESVFGNVEYVAIDGISGETAFVTKEMTEKAFNEAYDKLENAISRIRFNADIA